MNLRSTIEGIIHVNMGCTVQMRGSYNLRSISEVTTIWGGSYELRTAIEERSNKLVVCS